MADKNERKIETLVLILLQRFHNETKYKAQQKLPN